MNKLRINLAFTAIVLTLLACNTLSPVESPSTPVIILEPTNPPQSSNLPLTEDDAPRVSLEEAYTAHAAGDAIFLDVRSADSFAVSHITGAINIPLDVIEANPTGLSLDKEDWIITYCT